MEIQQNSYADTPYRAGRASAHVTPGPQEIPGETMRMLCERLCSYISRCGIEAEPRDIGAVLSEYAATGQVHIAPSAGTVSEICRKLTLLLSVFFGEKKKSELNTPSAVFLLSEDRIDELRATEVHARATGAFDAQAHYGISGESFRGILRETEEEFFVSEQNWRKVDELIKSCAPGISPGDRNRLTRRMERYSSCLMATGTDEADAFDRAVGRELIPVLYRLGGDNARRTVPETFNRVFQPGELPKSRRFLPVAGL